MSFTCMLKYLPIMVFLIAEIAASDGGSLPERRSRSVADADLMPPPIRRHEPWRIRSRLDCREEHEVLVICMQGDWITMSRLHTDIFKAAQSGAFLDARIRRLW